jgi:predicted ATPase
MKVRGLLLGNVARVDVELGPLTLLVGANGIGKSVLLHYLFEFRRLRQVWASRAQDTLTAYLQDRATTLCEPETVPGSFPRGYRTAHLPQMQ